MLMVMLAALEVVVELVAAHIQAEPELLVKVTQVEIKQLVALQTAVAAALAQRAVLVLL